MKHQDIQWQNKFFLDKCMHNQKKQKMNTQEREAKRNTVQHHSMQLDN